MTSHHSGDRDPLGALAKLLSWLVGQPLNLSPTAAMGLDFHLIANFAALALITLAGPAVIFVLFFRRGAL